MFVKPANNMSKKFEFKSPNFKAEYNVICKSDLKDIKEKHHLKKSKMFNKISKRLKSVESKCTDVK